MSRFMEGEWALMETLLGRQSSYRWKVNDPDQRIVTPQGAIAEFRAVNPFVDRAISVRLVHKANGTIVIDAPSEALAGYKVLKADGETAIIGGPQLWFGEE